MDPERQRRERVGPRGPVALRVVVGDERGRAVAAPGLARWLASVAPGGVAGTVSIAMISDARIRALNRRYRHRDYATDVLSFPAGESSGPKSPASSLFLGDIVIARGVARRQARVAGHSERTELRVLALHGLLHLAGYDHERDHGRMQRLEQRLRRKGGLREGLIERAAAKDHSHPGPRVYARGRGGAKPGRRARVGPAHSHSRPRVYARGRGKAKLGQRAGVGPRASKK